jgi:predicted RNA-binding protein YlxR (DUF448 family)
MRIVVSDLDGVATAEVDRRRRRPGRGCWLHPSPDCLDLALRRRAFARALRVQSSLDTDGLAASVVALAASGDSRSRP